MNSIAIIEIIIESKDNYFISCCHAKINSKSGFIINNPIYNIKSIEDLPDFVFKKTVYLSIHGKGVVTKDKNQIANFENIISENETYTQIYELNNYILVSYIRQDLLNHFLFLMFDKNILIKKIFIGASPLLHLILDQNDTNINIYKYKFSKINENQLKIASYISTDTITNYNNFQYPTEQCMFIGILMSNFKKTYLKDEFDKLLNLSSMYFFKRYYKIAQRSVIFLFFLFLIINFTFYMKFSSENILMSVDLVKLANYKNKKDSLQKVFNNQSLNHGIEEASYLKLSYFIDRIASSIPKGVTITEISLNPSKYIREKKYYLYDKNIILLFGISDNSFILNQWVKQLEQKKLIIKSNFNSYKQESGLSKGTFALELFYNNQWLEYIKKNEKE